MNAWHWWWCLLLILQLGKAVEITLQDEETEHKKEKITTEGKEENHRNRKRRDSEWFDDELNNEDEDSKQLYPLSIPEKRKPILSSWGGKRLSDFLYYKRKPAFSSWGGKRGPAFSSWGGKRSERHNIKNTLDQELQYSNESSSNDNNSSLFKSDIHFYFPEEEYGLNQILLDKYSDIFSMEDKENLKKIFNFPEDQPVPTEDFENSEQNYNTLLSSNMKNDDDDEFNHENLESQFNPSKMFPNEIDENGYKDLDSESTEDLTDINDNNIRADLNFEDGTVTLTNLFDKKASPSFNTWTGKRMPAFHSWGGKRAPAFNSWGGKRALAFNSWGGKRALAFNSWGGKRAPAFNSWVGKQTPAFNSLIAKRATAFNSWGGKRAAAFNSWGGKRTKAFNSWGGKRMPAFHSWGGKRAPAFNSWGGKRASPAFNSWGGKRTPAFNGWVEIQDEDSDKLDGETLELSMQRRKRSVVNLDRDQEEKQNIKYENLDEKRVPAFNSWGGKRQPSQVVNYKATDSDFNNWEDKRNTADNSREGKRAAAFNSWGGKRAPAFNSWGGKRMPAFNSWGGKRAPAFNSWGGKRAPAFNSWGGKRAPAFNSWGGKRAPAFNSWGGKRDPSFKSWGYDRNKNDISDKWDSFHSLTDKRLPATQSWEGKQLDALELDPLDQNYVKKNSLDFHNNYYLSSNTKNGDSLESENYNSDENNKNEYKKFEIEYPFFVKNKSYNFIENVNDKFNSETKTQPENDHISITKRDGEGKRNPAFFSWGGKRSEIPKQIYLLHSDDNSNEKMYYNIPPQKNRNLFNYKKNSFDERNNVNKRNTEFRYSLHNLPHLTKSGYAGKRKPAFSSWGGKRSDKSFGNQNIASNENLQYYNRKKRNIINSMEPSMSLATDNNNIDSFSSEGIFPDLPTGTMMCCVKRAQYGDRNLFMQMLLRTKSFKDLSWPTTRPIRRGSEFYPWGGKRSSL